MHCLEWYRQGTIQKTLLGVEAFRFTSAKSACPTSKDWIYLGTLSEDWQNVDIFLPTKKPVYVFYGLVWAISGFYGN